MEGVIRCWRIGESAEFALARHGFGNSDVEHGVTYPEDLDPTDEPIPAGSVEIYGGWGEVFSAVLAEATYLDVLAAPRFYRHCEALA